MCVYLLRANGQPIDRHIMKILLDSSIVTTCTEIAIRNARSSLTYESCGNKKNGTKKLNYDAILEIMFATFP
jgi:hypothetical protein